MQWSTRLVNNGAIKGLPYLHVKIGMAQPIVGHLRHKTGNNNICFNEYTCVDVHRQAARHKSLA